MTRKSLVCSLVLVIVSFVIVHVYGENFHVRKISDGNYHETLRRLQSLKASLTRHDSIASTPSFSPSPSSLPSEVNKLSCTTLRFGFYMRKYQMFDDFMSCRV